MTIEAAPKKKKDKMHKKKLKKDEVPNLAVLKVCGHSHRGHGWGGKLRKGILFALQSSNT